MIQLEEFSKHLKSITAGQWDTLFCLIPEIERTEVFGWVVESKLQPDGSYTFPYWNEADIVTRVSEIIYSRLMITPVYDWMKWEEGRELLDSEVDFKNLDSISICKLLTAIYRMDRFSEGHLVTMFNEGIMLKLIKGLEYHVTNRDIADEPSRYHKFLQMFKKK
jgi:hypothetical protein